MINREEINDKQAVEFEKYPLHYAFLDREFIQSLSSFLISTVLICPFA